ncbi:MAG: YitT family protein [Clostridia bacterium]|nr:YitT family protein [Clostridia bacterium]
MGLGLIFKSKSSTGGTDLLVSLIKSISNKFNASNLIIIIDVIIISANFLVFKEIEIVLYSCIAIFMSGKMIDIVFEGINFSKTLYIISDKTEEISKKMMEELVVRSNSFIWKRFV